MRTGHPQYHKIPTIWKRESERPHRLLEGTFATPELEVLSGLDWLWSEKVDGTNVRVGWDGDKVAFGGKTDKAQMPIHLMEELHRLFGGEEGEQLFEQVFPTADDEAAVTLYGEGYGAKIQKGGGNYNPEGASFVLFDVRIGHWWLLPKDVEGIAESLGVETVPIVGRGTLQEASDRAKEGFHSRWGSDVTPEGLVLRPPLGLCARSGRRIVAKIKQADFPS
jgi:hypothetical protein